MGGRKSWCTGRDEGDVYRQKRQCRMLRVRLVVRRLGVERVGVAQRRERYRVFRVTLQSQSTYGGVWSRYICARHIVRGVLVLKTAAGAVGSRVHAVVSEKHRVWARKDE
jgi:hypothetical protein